MYRLRITAGAGSTWSFTLLEGSRARLVSPDYADRGACVDGLRRLIYALRGVGHSALLEGLDEARARSLRAWAASHERFAISRRALRSRAAAGVSVTRASYELDPEPAPGEPGLALYRRVRDGLYCARINDATGRALLLMPGFTRARRRDDNLRVVLEVGGDASRYTRRAEAGRWYFILRGRNHREVARSRWFTREVELDAALLWLLVAVVELTVHVRAPSPREHPRALPRAALSTPGAPGIERLDLDARRFGIRLNDASGVAIAWSHSYRSAAARERGLRALLLALVTAEGFRYERDGDGVYVLILARNHRALARSRSYATRDALDPSLDQLRSQLLADAASQELLERDDAQLIAAPMTADAAPRPDTSPLEAPRANDGADDPRERAATGRATTATGEPAYAGEVASQEATSPSEPPSAGEATAAGEPTSVGASNASSVDETARPDETTPSGETASGSDATPASEPASVGKASAVNATVSVAPKARPDEPTPTVDDDATPAGDPASVRESPAVGDTVSVATQARPDEATPTVDEASGDDATPAGDPPSQRETPSVGDAVSAATRTQPDETTPTVDEASRKDATPASEAPSVGNAVSAATKTRTDGATPTVDEAAGKDATPAGEAPSVGASVSATRTQPDATTPASEYDATPADNPAHAGEERRPTRASVDELSRRVGPNRASATAPTGETASAEDTPSVGAAVSAGEGASASAPASVDVREPPGPITSSSARRRPPAGGARIVKSTDSSSLAEVVDRILDRGVVLDVWSRVSVVGVQLVAIEARVVIASSETYLRYAEAIGLTATTSPSA